jgi:K+-sensing histidine kinase KdpD
MDLERGYELNTPKKILVCVTQQKTCERLIKKAAKLKDSPEDELFVIHVAKNEWNFLDNIKEGEALEYLFDISKTVGANLTVLRSDSIVKTISDFVHDNRINYVILGESPNDHKENKFAEELKSQTKNVEIIVIPQQEF